MNALRTLKLAAACIALSAHSSASAMAANSAQKDPPKQSASTETRLKALETKTNYYKKSTQAISSTFGTLSNSQSSALASGTSSPAATAAAAAVSCNSIDIDQDPQIQGFGTLYTWTTVDFSYAYPEPPDLSYQLFGLQAGYINSGGEEVGRCNDPIPADSAFGTISYKMFCTFDVRPGTMLRYHLTVNYNGCGADIVVKGLSLTTKSNLLEMVEPAN